MTCQSLTLTHNGNCAHYCDEQAVGEHQGNRLCYAHLVKAGGTARKLEPDWDVSARWARLDRETAVAR
jgi:hypothetical protein